MSKKLNVVLSDRDFEMLERLSASKGRDVPDLLRRAIEVGVWYQRDIEGSGKGLQVTNPDGVVQDVAPLA